MYAVQAARSAILAIPMSVRFTGRGRPGRGVGVSGGTRAAAPTALSRGVAAAGVVGRDLCAVLGLGGGARAGVLARGRPGRCTAHHAGTALLLIAGLIHQDEDQYSNNVGRNPTSDVSQHQLSTQSNEMSPWYEILVIEYKK